MPSLGGHVLLLYSVVITEPWSLPLLHWLNRSGQLHKNYNGKALKMNILRSLMALILLAGFTGAARAQTQVPQNCDVTTASDPDRQVLTCALGIVIELEAAAQMGFSDLSSGSAPGVIDLDVGAALIEVEPGTALPQIRTPHAIAAVRGTVYIVDVTPEKTSVFVVHGEVSVTQHDTSDDPVLLTAGDGVDVGPGLQLEVRRWGDERAKALLARFAR